jgi:arginyl-tRNA synthetase
VYELCHLLNIFYTNCQVNNEENEDIKNSRLLLLKIFKNIVNNFAEIIGIYIPNKM